MENNTTGAVSHIADQVILIKHPTGAVLEQVLVGPHQLIGEVIEPWYSYPSSLSESKVQVFEDTSGLEIGDTVICTGQPLSAELGPGIMGKVYDGLQRPLVAIAEATGGIHIPRGIKQSALDKDKLWPFVPAKGLKVGYSISPGDLIGIVKETSLFEHRICYPPRAPISRITYIAPANNYTLKDIVLEVQCEEKTLKFTMMHSWPIRHQFPVANKLAPDTPMWTGLRVIDALFPCLMGNIVIMPGGFGCGKTVLLQHLAMYSTCDVVVYVFCGERGNDVAETIRLMSQTTIDVKGKKESIMNRTIIIANTSDMPRPSRCAAVYLGITICEYIRNQGYNVVMLLDSLTRWVGALAGVEKQNAYISDLFQRAGNVECSIGSGSLSLICAVALPGKSRRADFVQNQLRPRANVVWYLDHKLAKKRYFPAIDLKTSFSKNIDKLVPFYDFISEDCAAICEKIADIMYQEADLSDTVFLVGVAALNDRERITWRLGCMIREDLLCQDVFTSYDRFCPLYKTFCMMRTFIKFHDEAQMAAKAFEDPLAKDFEDPQVVSKHISRHMGDVIIRLSRMRYVDPEKEDGGEQSVVCKYQWLADEIQLAFNAWTPLCILDCNNNTTSSAKEKEEREEPETNDGT